MSPSKRVAVIGAGPSGLVTIKELRDEGHDPTCFEKAAGLAGVFRFGESAGVVWDSCRLTSSGLLMAFSDFPVLAGEAEHMSASEYAGYLARYCDAFGVGRHIRFGATVESVTRSPRGEWAVRTADSDGARHEERFDAVAVCSGLNQHPHLPRFPGQDSFTGTIMHGSQYRRPAQALGKRVLVVGGGESGADIVAEVSECAAETVLSLRRGVAVVRRRNYGRPNDYRLCRLNHSAAHWVAMTRNPRDDWKRRVYRAVFLPFVLLDKFLQVVSSLVYDLLPLFHPRRLSCGRAAIAEIRAGLKTRRMIGRLLEESGGTVMEQFGTKSEDFVKAMAMGRCRRAGPIARFDGRRVLFQDGSTFEPDVVIFCTGFEAKMPFLDEALAGTGRYLHAFNPAIGASLGFIGFLRPAHGAIPPLSELQARWFALLLSGKVELPLEGEMRDSIARLVGVRQHLFRAVHGRLDYLVDYTSFCDELASKIGCKPSRAAVRQESLAFRLRFFASPFVAAQYRLIGPHAKPGIARQVITNLPVTHPVPTLAALYLRWKSSRALHRILGPEFAPKLELQTR